MSSIPIIMLSGYHICLLIYVCRWYHMDLREESFILRDYINYALPFPVAAGLSVDKTSECLITVGRKLDQNC